MPPWIGAGFLVPPDANVDRPPRDYPEWRTWIRGGGGVVERTTQVRITLAAREELMVVVDAIRVRIHARKAAEILAIVDGKRQAIKVSDGGRPFVTAGAANASSRHMAMSGGGEWDPPV